MKTLDSTNLAAPCQAPAAPAGFRDRLLSVLTQYDRKLSSRRFYNPHALGLYFERADEICADISKGADPRAAICAGFTGALLAAVLRGMGFEKPSDDEWHGVARAPYYMPASANKGGAL